MFQSLVDEKSCHSVIDTNNCNNWVTWNSIEWKQKSIENKPGTAQVDAITKAQK